MADEFQKRINYSGDIQELARRIADDYGFGKFKSAEPIATGFEDYNLKIHTKKGTYVVKIFSKQRWEEDILRNVEILKAVVAAGVNHPELFYDRNGQLLHVDIPTHLQMITMKYIEGKTFHQLGKPPTIDQLEVIAREAVKINKTNCDPPFLFDAWAIPNMRWMFHKVEDHLTPEIIGLLSQAFDRFNAIPFDQLTKCFVHGDLNKANLILGKDGRIYVIDFSVSNTYPRIQELAVMATNLLFDEKAKVAVPLRRRLEEVKNSYSNAGGVLTEVEEKYLFDYCLPAAAMEYMGSVNERIVSGDEDVAEEIRHWENLALKWLREALA
jgi:Ser/Thr protein kinase RdoA (MazF antagonist)